MSPDLISLRESVNSASAASNSAWAGTKVQKMMTVIKKRNGSEREGGGVNEGPEINLGRCRRQMTRRIFRAREEKGNNEVERRGEDR